MKKILILVMFCSLFDIGNNYAQMVDRQLVLIEKITGINCSNCPAAANGIHEMMAEGLKIASVNYHWWYFDKVFSNEYGQERIEYYYPENPTDVFAPTAIFNGTKVNGSGGGSTVSTYNSYKADYDEAVQIKSPLYIEIVSTEKKTNEEWTVMVTVTKKDASFDASNAILQTVLTESNIQHPWLGIGTVEHAERNMYPNPGGIPVVFDAQNKFTYETTVKIENDWKYYNCEIVAFVQNWNDKSVYQANSIRLSNTVLAMVEDVTLTTNQCSKDINISWSDGQYNKVQLLGYDIYNGKDKVNTDLITGNNYLINNAKIGSNCISIIAVYDLGSSSKSYAKCVDVNYPAGPTSLVSSINTNHVTLNWTEPLGVDTGGICYDDFVGYNVFRDGKKINGEPIKGATYTDITPSVGSFLYYIVAQYKNADSYRSNTLVVDVTTVSVESIIKNNFNVYPNPVNASSGYILNIDNAKNIYSCVIKDITGKTVLISAEQNKVDMSSLNNGMYLVSVKTDLGSKTFKVIKK